MNIARRVLLLGCLLAVIFPTIALSSDQSEVIIVRKFQAERNGSASLIVDRVDYNQKGMSFFVAGDAEAKVFDFVKASVGKKIRVTYTMGDGCDFCIYKAVSISDRGADNKAASPSFDCAKASTKTEKLICSNTDLAALDVKLSETYRKFLSTKDDKEFNKQEQNKWLKTVRDVCADITCLSTAYKQRIDWLENQ